MPPRAATFALKLAKLYGDILESERQYIDPSGGSLSSGTLTAVEIVVAFYTQMAVCKTPRPGDPAADRETWRSLTYNGAAAFEEDRQHCLQAARDKPPGAALLQVYTQHHQCPTCGRYCASVLGLRSHMRSHC